MLRKKWNPISSQEERREGSFFPEYTIWGEMKARCLNKNRENYGGRGITVCSRWLRFEEFIKDMGTRPSKNHSIDRIDNDKGYFKENCKWATWKEQSRNKRNNVNITYQGKTQCLPDWAEELGISKSTLQSRINRSNWPIERAFTTLANKPQNHH